MAESLDSFALYYSQNGDHFDEPLPAQISSKLLSPQNIEQTNNSPLYDVSSAQEITSQELTNVEQSQAHLLNLTSTTCDSAMESKERRIIPVSEILAESVKSIFMANENCSHDSFKSSGDVAIDDCCDMFQEDVELQSEFVFKKYKRDTVAIDEDDKVDPFSDSCRIPLPGSLDTALIDCGTFVRRRNERERARVRSVNEGFERLRAHLPFEMENNQHQRLSKAETLHCAIQYIHHLQSILNESI